MGLLEVQKKALEASYGKMGYAYFDGNGPGEDSYRSYRVRTMVEEKKATRLVVTCPIRSKTGWVEEIKKHAIECAPISTIREQITIMRSFSSKPYDRAPSSHRQL